MSKKIVLEAKNLSKKVGKRMIVNNVSIDLFEGDILGFIGPNGAGKTTTIKMLLGLQLPSEGTVKISGCDLKKDFAYAISNVGAIVENPDHYMYLSGYENLEIAANLYGLNEEDILRVAKIVGLEDRIYDKVKKYSLGMRQRLGIAQAIIHKPKVLILDEPMNGLDPEGIKDLKMLIKKLAYEENMAILISSHLLSELESFCNRIVILSKGKILKNLEMDEISEASSSINYIFEVDRIDIGDKLNNYKIIDNNHIRINTNKDNLSNILKTLLLNNIEVYEMKKETTTLEDIFINITKDGSND